MPVREVMLPAKRATEDLKGLERLMTRANADGEVSRAEKRDIVDRTKTVEKHAQAMVAHQGQPIVKLMEDIRKLAHTGRLNLKIDDAIADVVHERHATWRRARHDAQTNPFDHLRHTKAPFPGVRTRDFDFHGARAHVVAIDLNNPNVKLQTTGPGDRNQHVATMAQRKNAEIAINGDFFSLATRIPSGLNRHRGRDWGGEADGFEDALAFNGRHAQIIPGMHDAPKWAKNIVSARHAVVVNGEAFSERELLRREGVTAGEREKVRADTPRTGVGLSRDGRVLYLFAISHADEAKLGKLMKQHGVHMGFSMDAGGSAEMYQRGRGIVQDGYGNGERRRVANAILVQANR